MTKKACINRNVEIQFAEALSHIDSYQIAENNLAFYNTEGEEVLSFIKNDKRVADYRINDIWLATSMGGRPINRMVTAPRLEINLNTMQVMSNDGCNDFSGTISRIDETNIVFGNIAATQKACKKMEVVDRFNKALSNTSSYKFENGTLKLYDTDNNEVLTFLI